MEGEGSADVVFHNEDAGPSDVQVHNDDLAAADVQVHNNDEGAPHDSGVDNEEGGAPSEADEASNLIKSLITKVKYEERLVMKTSRTSKPRSSSSYYRRQKRNYIQVAKMVQRYLLLWNFSRLSACMG
jgi:hypothetical protein